jgi:transcriptional regulator with XRE-family HTH domain
MATFGEKLKGERENRGVRLDEIAAATKISERYLEALEAGAFERLPTEVFAKGYIRAYAQHIGADADELIKEYERERGRETPGSEDDDKIIQEMSRILTVPGESPASRRRRAAVWIAGVLVIVAAVVWLGVRRGPPEPPSRPLESETLTATAIVEPPPVVAEPEPEQAPPTEPSAALRVSVPDYGVGTGIVNRRLVGIDNRFTEGQLVWFWTKVLGARPGETIRHVWSRDGREITTIELQLGGSHWRTQSSKVLRASGAWAVEARDNSGRVLARREFLCVAAGVGAD